MKFFSRLKFAWRILTFKPGNLMRHAKEELGMSLDIELEELILVFSSQGHTGGSAFATIGLLEKLLRYEPVYPLTGESEEWVEVAEEMYQNKRCGRVFKSKDRFNGQAYDIDGIVWQDPDGSRFTNGESAVPITFPYTPHTEYRDRPPKNPKDSDKEGERMLQE